MKEIQTVQLLKVRMITNLEIIIMNKIKILIPIKFLKIIIISKSIKIQFLMIKISIIVLNNCGNSSPSNKKSIKLLNKKLNKLIFKFQINMFQSKTAEKLQEQKKNI